MSTEEDLSLGVRGELLDALSDLWQAQYEVLRLAEHWSRYESAIDGARQRLLAEINDKRHASFREAFDAAVEHLADSGLSDTQVHEAVRRALRDVQDETQPSDVAKDNNAGRILNGTARRQDLGLLSSQLVTLVSDFEVFLLRMMTAWVEHDDAVLAGRVREVKFDELGNYTSTSQIRDLMAESYLEELMRAGLRGAVNTIGKVCGGKGGKVVGADDFGFVEPIQRRHVIIHHGGAVSKRYLNELKGFAHQAVIGQHLPVDLAYVQDAADAMARVAHSLALMALYKSAGTRSEREWVEAQVGELTYVLLVQDRERVVDAYLKDGFDESRCVNEFAREQTRVNGWIARRRLADSSYLQEVESWNVNAKSDQFKLAKAALLKDLDTVAVLVRRMERENKIRPVMLLTWPLFEEIRDEVSTLLDNAGSSSGGRSDGGHKTDDNAAQ